MANEMNATDSSLWVPGVFMTLKTWLVVTKKSWGHGPIFKGSSGSRDQASESSSLAVEGFTYLGVSFRDPKNGCLALSTH